MKLSDPDRYSLVEYLKGSASSIQQGLALMDLDESDYDIDEIQLDMAEEIENCNACNWWHSVDEMNATDLGDMLCDDCLEEERKP